jgi:hypothetical protein
MTWWHDEGAAPAWQDSHFYLTGDLVLGSYLGVDYVWQAANDGFSDVTEPVWDTGLFQVTDGAVAWALIATWGPSDFSDTALLVMPTAPNGHYYASLGAGTNGATEPSPWPTDGSNVDDGGTGSQDGSLIDPDGTNNDTGTGGSAAGLSSHYIYQIWENPALDRDAAPIGTLTEASARRFRKVKNNCGEGELTINSHSDEAAWLVQGRIVVVYREAIDTAPVFAWSLEETSQVVVPEDEEGADLTRWTGRGVLALLERAVLWNYSVLPNGADLGALPQSDRDGMWHWVHKSASAILVRQLEEAQYRGTYFGSGIQDCAIPNIYWTFARHSDSNGDPYTEEGPYKLAVGDNLFSDVLPKLMQIGLLIKATPVINGDGHLRVRLDAYASDPGAMTGITFSKGVNILAAGEKLVAANSAGTDALVQGDLAAGTGPQPYVYVERSDGTFRAQVGRKEIFLPYQATADETMLEHAGDILLANGVRRHNGPTTLQVMERPGEVALLDYTEWDYVTVDIPGAWDSYTDNLSEIILVENDIGVFDIGVQFATDDPVGVVGIAVDNCACGQEPAD